MRRAEWRSLPEDSAPLLRRAWRAMRPLPRRLALRRPRFPVWGFAWKRAILLFGLISSVIFALLIVSFMPPPTGAVFGVFLLLMAFLGAVFGIGWLCGWGEPPARLSALAADPAPGESFPVRVVLQGPKRASRDAALATFVQGWLYVEGLRTSFSLRACDVGTFVETRRGHVRLDLPEGQRVEFRTFDPTEAAVFRHAFRIWHYYTIESPEGESRLPPL